MIFHFLMGQTDVILISSILFSALMGEDTNRREALVGVNKDVVRRLVITLGHNN
jgi:hypothetical protein